jgi:hypothetical protein
MRPASLVFVSLLTACGASSSPSSTPASPPEGTAISATAVPSATPAPTASAAPTAAAAAAAPATASLPRAEIPKPLSAEESKQLTTKCKPLVDAYQKNIAKSNARGRLNMVIEGLKATLASPPPRTSDTCLALLEREARAYVINTMGVEPTVVLQGLARAMRAALAEKGQLCPSTTAPLPPKIPAFYTNLTSADWQDPTWKCLNYVGVISNTSVQLEVVTRADGATFIARGIPFPDEGKVVEWRLDARVEGGTLVFDKPASVP